MVHDFLAGQSRPCRQSWLHSSQASKLALAAHQTMTTKTPAVMMISIMLTPAQAKLPDHSCYPNVQISHHAHPSARAKGTSISKPLGHPYTQNATLPISSLGWPVCWLRSNLQASTVVFHQSCLPPCSDCGGVCRPSQQSVFVLTHLCTRLALGLNAGNDNFRP